MGLPAGCAISRAELSRCPELSAALAAAFHDDPVFRWLLPERATRAAALHRFFAIEARDVVLPRGWASVATAEARTLGAAFVLPPGRWRSPPRVQIRRAPEYLRIFRRRLPHAFGVLTALERLHPGPPHYYLPYIGVIAAARGRGIGTALLTSLLRRCDREGLPAYLEASSPDNARLSPARLRHPADHPPTRVAADRAHAPPPQITCRAPEPGSRC